MATPNDKTTGSRADESRRGPSDESGAGGSRGSPAQGSQGPGGKRPGRSSQHGNARPQDLAYFIMAGIALFGGIGYGLDRLLGTTPILLAVGIFAGLAFSLYVAYLRLR